jgi:hypothetical protein
MGRTYVFDARYRRIAPGEKKENNPDALSVEEFMEFVRKGFEGDKEMIGAGTSEKVVEKWYEAFGESYEKASI